MKINCPWRVEGCWRSPPVSKPTRTIDPKNSRKRGGYILQWNREQDFGSLYLSWRCFMQVPLLQRAIEWKLMLSKCYTSLSVIHCNCTAVEVRLSSLAMLFSVGYSPKTLVLIRLAKVVSSLPPNVPVNPLTNTPMHHLQVRFGEGRLRLCELQISTNGGKPLETP